MKKILLIEDDQVLASIYMTKFKQMNYDCTLAIDGEDGLAVARSLLPDIILLDIILPKKDGFGVLKELKNSSATKKIPVILLTNLGQESDIAKGSELGAESYMLKANTTPTQVIEGVENILEKKGK